MSTDRPPYRPSDTSPQRHFNTTRELLAVGDSSTIDFAFLPRLFESSWGPEPALIRVPILPDIASDAAEAVLEKYPELDSAAGGYQDTPGQDTVLKAQISTVNGDDDSPASPFSDVHDGHHASEMSVDALTKLAETVSNSARQFAEMVKDKDEATVRKVWAGFLDDLFGPANKNKNQ